MTGVTVHVPRLTTQRLVLRAPHIGDLEAYTAFRSDPQRTQGVGGPKTPHACFEQLTDAIGSWHIVGFGRFIVADKETDEALGIVGPYAPPSWPEPELAWSVFAAAEGRGVAYEATLEARRFAYTTLGWTTAVSMIMPTNARSIALAVRLGCSHEADQIHPDYGPMMTWRHPAPDQLDLTTGAVRRPTS